MNPIPEMFLPRTARAWYWWGAKAVASLALLGLALRHVPVGSLAGALRQANGWWLAGSLFAFIGGVLLFEPLRLVAGARLVRESPVRFGEWALLFLQSRAFLYILPSGMGQEGFLWWRLRRLQWSHGSCAFVVMMVRATGLACWTLAMAWALGSPAFRAATGPLLPGRLGHPVLWLALSALLLAVIFALPHLLLRMGRLENYRASWAAWGSLVPPTLAACLASAVAFQWAGLAFGLHFPLAQAAGCLTLLFIGMVLPISLAGLGLQEGILLLAGHALGMASGPILGLSCILHLQRLVLAIMGLGCFLLGRTTGETASSPR